MTIVELLEIQAAATKKTLAPYVIDYFADTFRVMQYPVNPDRPPIIVKRYLTHEAAEEFLLSIAPKPARTRVEP